MTDAWVPPPTIDALLERLAVARDSDVPARERENLCASSHRMITRLTDSLRALVDDAFPYVEQPSWIRPARGLGVQQCRECGVAKKGEVQHGHDPQCEIGRAEALLRGGT